MAGRGSYDDFQIAVRNEVYQGTRRTLNATIAKKVGGLGVASFSNFGVSAVLADIGTRMPQEMANAVKLFAKAFGSTTRRNQEARLRNSYNDAARVAQLAVVEAYKSRFNLNNPYRVGDRFSGGVLLKALESPNLYRVAADGVAFINRPFLDQAAAQWYRLNFGAGAIAQNRPSSPRMTLFGVATTIDFSLKRFPKSKAFTMPALPGRSGSIVGSSNGLQFYPYKVEGVGRKLRWISKRITTKGIVGQFYLDEGVNSLKKTMPYIWARHLENWFIDAVELSTGPISRFAPDKQTLSTAETLIRTEINRGMAKLGPIAGQLI